MDYNNTFTKRGKDYKYAIDTYPNAMDDEFRIAINICQIEESDIVLNIPSACIPIEKYFDTHPICYYQFETNEDFANLVGHKICSWTNIPLSNETCTKILCLASLHHSTNEERQVIYRECWRLLKPGGKLIIGDVAKGSNQDKWLNIFVNKYNSNGHNGKFWDDDDTFLLKQAGYTNIQIQNQEYFWKFPSNEGKLDFCKHLFGLDLANNELIQDGLSIYLNNSKDDLNIKWNLIYFIATKPQNISLNMN
jgi:SAM-dependent methyltransferase